MTQQHFYIDVSTELSEKLCLSCQTRHIKP